MLLSSELKLLLLHFSRHKQSPQLNSPGRVPAGIRPYPLPTPVHRLPPGLKRKWGSVWNGKKMSPMVWVWFPQPWQGVEGHRGNLWTAWGGAGSPAPKHPQHLWGMENGIEKGWVMEINSGGHSLTPLSSPPCPCTRWVDRPAPAHPAVAGDRAWREGLGEKSFPSGTVGSAWSEMGVWGVMCPSASVTTPLCQWWHYPPGKTCFLCLKKKTVLSFHLNMQLISSSNGAKRNR